MNEGNISLETQALRFSRSLESSLKAYQRLLELEKEQSSSIEAADIEAVATKIESKNSLLAELKQTDKELHDQHLLWQQVRDQAPDPLRERLQNQVNTLQEAMTQLLDQQKSNEKSLQKHGEEINRRLKELNRGKEVQKGYRQRAAGEAYSQSKFYDKNH